MTTQPPVDPPPSEPAAPAPRAAAPVDWPDRSHFSEFDAAIEAELATPEVEPAALRVSHRESRREA
jgi:hypothetical protein